jgi:hypothetical protein
MSRAIIVAFGQANTYDFRVTDGELSGATDDSAQRWLDEQWAELECEPVRPSGKVLLFDKILGVARHGGQGRFAENGPWARTFARHVALLVRRPVVVVDVADNRVG